MISKLLARTLAHGVEVSALLSYRDIEDLLSKRETISDTVFADEDRSDFATFEILAVQELDNAEGRSIEIRVLASDGTNEVTAYLYARPEKGYLGS